MKKWRGALIKVNPKFSTQDCSCWGNRVRKLSQSAPIFAQNAAQFLDSDYNASLNILQKALEELLVAH
ncbi:zinc ribbon domain-containing protein [Bacillus sp. T33-2]|uniref:zinc ribbon domain-containing protein n=1 Tax=Bacillus sp. T33-2 TaxID=2054168 RepID=UPI0015E074E7|nr:zinc ribbon domain-containing protein [Bacillus sp. T33-2]